MMCYGTFLKTEVTQMASFFFGKDLICSALWIDHNTQTTCSLQISFYNVAFLFLFSEYQQIQGLWGIAAN